MEFQNRITPFQIYYADGLKFIDKKIIENVIKEREEGGIFVKDSLDEEKTPSLTPLDSGISDQMKNRVALMAERLCMLGNMMGGFDHRLNNLVSNNNERDTIVIELFKKL